MKNTVATISTCYNTGSNLQPVDTRSPITVWDLLVWAYSREMVRFAGTGGYDNQKRLAYGNSVTADICARLEVGDISRSCVTGGRPSAHPDAETVHDVVQQLISSDYWLVVRSAESARPPEWGQSVDIGTLKPRRRANGRLKMIRCPKSHRPIACVLELDGYTPAEADRIITEEKKVYERWYNLLVLISGELKAIHTLTRWKITDIGIDSMPWEK